MFEQIGGSGKKPAGRSSSPAPESGRESGRGRRLYWRISGLIMLLAVLYSGGAIYLRWHANQEYLRQQAAQRAARQREQDEAATEALGSGRLTILSFYAAPGRIARGETTQICYGVSNTKSVRIEPPIGEVWPSFARCVNVHPSRTTTYTLTAEDAAGKTQAAVLTIAVR